MMDATPIQPGMTDWLMTRVRFAVDGYKLGKWSIYQAGAQISEALAEHLQATGD